MIKDLHNKLINNEISSEDLVNESINKINETNDKLNAFNLVINDYKVNNNTGSLINGIPYALKDNISTKGIRTTACSDTLKDYVPIYDATIVKKLNEAGAVLVGKTNLDELAMGGTGTTGNTGIVHNPYDLDRIAGGSSAGSSVAVAAGIVPFAIGSDTGDSIRKPAAYTGVVGYKPSYGLISRYGLFAFASSLDHLGVFSNNVEDAAIVTNYIKGYDTKDMTSISDMDDVDLTRDINNDITGKKLFYIKEICNPDNYENTDTKNILNSFNKLLSNLKNKGFEVIEESIDIKLLNAIKPVYDSISCAEATSNDSNLTGIIFGPRAESNNVMEMIKKHRTEGFSPLIKRRFVIGSYVLQKENQEKYFLNAKRVRRLLVEKMDELFAKYDGMILPCSGNIAPLIEKSSNKITRNETILENHLAIGNFGGYPSITLPYEKYNNMPVGINITCGYKKDSKMFNIAKKVEDIIGGLK